MDYNTALIFLYFLAFIIALAIIVCFLFVIYELLGKIVYRLKEITVLKLKSRDEAIRKRWRRIYRQKKRKKEDVLIKPLNQRMAYLWRPFRKKQNK